MHVLLLLLAALVVLWAVAVPVMFGLCASAGRGERELERRLAAARNILAAGEPSPDGPDGAPRAASLSASAS